MQYTSILLSAATVGSALAASSVTTHVVNVGGNGTLTFSPDNLKANVGDMVQFQFNPKNHTVTQSNFDNPCEPISLHDNSVPGIYSGFMPVSDSDTSAPTYTILINSTTPTWLYCSQGKHCQAGMVMVINENTSANSTRSLANFQAAAAKATQNLAPSGDATNGTTGTATASGSSTSSLSSSSSSSSSGASSAASSYKVSGLLLGGLFAAGMAFLA